MAISAEELEYLLRPSQNKESAESDQMQNGEDAEMQKPDEDDTHSQRNEWIKMVTWKEELTSYIVGKRDFLLSYCVIAVFWL